MSQSISRQPILSDEQTAVFDQLSAFAKDPPNLTFCVHGLAGTGKTTLLSQFARTNAFATLCTFTGKAASILRRKTGLNAQTIHSFFYRLKEIERLDRNRQKFHWDKAHAQDSLTNRVVLLDECGMVGNQIVRDILNTGAVIIATGDPGQLKPVNQDAYFTTPDTSLTTIHRQALDSPIIRQAHRVRQAQSYEPDTEQFTVRRGFSEQSVLDADIILCWTNKTRQRMNAIARSYRGLWPINPQVGEPLMCLKNYGDAGIYNGAIYELLEPFNEGDTAIVIDVDGTPRTIPGVKFHGLENKIDPNDATTSFTFGYTCTVHKAAGSEWRSVLLIDEYRLPEDRERWLYTAITRASEKITIVQ